MKINYIPQEKNNEYMLHTPAMETKEDIYKIIEDSYEGFARNSMRGLFDVFSAMNPDKKPILVWEETLEYVLTHVYGRDLSHEETK